MDAPARIHLRMMPPLALALAHSLFVVQHLTAHAASAQEALDGRETGSCAPAF